MEKLVYADNAATTKISKNVIEVMMPYLLSNYGNPSSIYSMGRSAKMAVEQSRKQIANSIGADPREIFFTSGGTEADNWAIKGMANKLFSRNKKHVITSAIEHHAVLHTVEQLEKKGYEVTILPVDSYGFIDLYQLEQAIRSDTALVSIMYANNEIGTIQNIPEIGKICRNKGVFFHTDAVQAIGNIHLNVVAQNIDLLSISGHKINAPKGVGALYVRSGISINSIITGGAQERSKRSGTENVASIVGFGEAISYATQNIDKKISTVLPIRDYLIERVMNEITKTKFNGPSDDRRLCHNANFSFYGIEGESLLLMLDNVGICASSGSACTSGSLDPSHVLMAIGLTHEIAHGSLRLTFSTDNTKEDVDYIVNNLIPIIKKLRAMSPIW